MQDAAKELFDARKFKESIEGYEKAELYCRKIHRHIEHEQRDEVLKLLVLCMLNRSLCYFQSHQYEQSYLCSVEVYKQQFADSTSKFKAVIRAGQSLCKLCAKASEDEKIKYLKRSLEYCELGDKMAADDASLKSNNNLYGR